MTELAPPLETGWLPDTPIGGLLAAPVPGQLGAARCADTPDLPAVTFTSDNSRPGFLRMGFLPITRFTLWAVAA